MSQELQALHGRVSPDAETLIERHRTLVFVTSRPLLSGSLIRAVENEFPHMRVREAASIQAACARNDGTVAAVFVDIEKIGELKLWLKRLTQTHPLAAIALLQTDHRHVAPLPEIIRSPGICGVLPMHLKLDVWLAVIRLMLFGGEYVPMSLLRSAPEALSWSATLEPTPRLEGEEDLYSLTERELQILDLVARGQQNKVIAASLQLSEHTVKIHLHNIITKLGTTNRTEAAAIYHRQRGMDPDHRAARAR